MALEYGIKACLSGTPNVAFELNTAKTGDRSCDLGAVLAKNGKGEKSVLFGVQEMSEPIPCGTGASTLAVKSLHLSPDR